MLAAALLSQQCKCSEAVLECKNVQQTQHECTPSLSGSSWAKDSSITSVTPGSETFVLPIFAVSV